MPDCYLRGWRRSGANFLKSKINNHPLSFHPLLPPALYTSLHFCTLWLNSSHCDPASCGNVPLGDVDPPVILFHWLILLNLAGCLLSPWGCISFMCWLQKQFVIGTANGMRRFPLGCPCFLDCCGSFASVRSLLVAPITALPLHSILESLFCCWICISPKLPVSEKIQACPGTCTVKRSFYSSVFVQIICFHAK